MKYAQVKAVARKRAMPLFRKHGIKIGVAVVLLVWWWCCLPKPLFTDPTATVVTAADNTLIGGRIAADGQWRFPALDSVPKRFEECVLQFEDAYFYQHPGFNPVAMLKAIAHNLTHNSRRGGSTITQQVIRLSRKQKKRSYLEKGIEIIMATRLEWRYAKKDILKLYATHTPYGGNVVGLETAAWRYFGLPAHELSWGQSATLAVLPNAPSLIFPGKNEHLLRAKRNRLLQKLWRQDCIDKETYELAIAEPLPQKPFPLPDMAPHLTERVKKEHPGKRIHTSIALDLQQRANQIAANHYQRLKQNEIHNLAILVLDVQTKKVLCYVGNAPTVADHAKHVDIITKNRSTGSTLKPFLFAALLQEGLILPNSLVRDVPTVINGYQPKNFNLDHVGAVAASRALSRSLNVPAVRLLRKYGLEKFYNKLHQMQVNSLHQPASHYGLSLILGGAESSLWEVTQTYAGAAATLNYFMANSSTYNANEFVEHSYLLEEEHEQGPPQADPPVFGAGALYHTFLAMNEVNRPEGDEQWQFFDSSKRIAWKTGTSFGFKDAWAVGVTPRHAIGVWAGNADGEGRPGLTGITAAAPILFDMLDLLPDSGWFAPPYDDMVSIATCAQSGHRASIYCQAHQQWVPAAGVKSGPCPYHQQIALDASATFRVNAGCYPLDEIVHRNWFTLPPTVAHYYGRANPNYRALPDYLEGCSPEEAELMAFIFPKRGESIILPKDLGKTDTAVVFKLAHQETKSTVYWYLDEKYVGATTNFHELVLDVAPGVYVLTATDDKGNRLQQQIHINLATER
ncbi:MAG: penicillin-binding protein 1C [Bacteroidota bacterium]